MSFTHVQGAGATTSANVLTLSMTLGAAPTAGNVVCVGLNITYSGATAPTGLTIKDDAGHSYVITPNSPAGQVDDAGAFSGPVWLAYLLPIPSGASATITATWASTTGTAGVQLFADEFSSTTPMSFDKDIAATGTTAGTTINTPSITPTFPNSLLYACAGSTGTISAPAAGGTLGSWTGCGAGILDGDTAEYDLSASAATAVDYTTSSAEWSSVAMAFAPVNNGRNMALLGIS